MPPTAALLTGVTFASPSVRASARRIPYRRSRAGPGRRRAVLV